MREIKLVNGEYYHIFNRGNNKRIIFSDDQDFARFFKSMSEFNSIESIGSIFENSFKLPAARTPCVVLKDTQG